MPAFFRLALTTAAVKNLSKNFQDAPLALMYHQGTGVERDFITAYKWLFIAVNSGNELMREQLRRIASSMTTEEIDKAQTLAMNWAPGN